MDLSWTRFLILAQHHLEFQRELSTFRKELLARQNESASMHNSERSQAKQRERTEAPVSQAVKNKGKSSLGETVLIATEVHLKEDLLKCRLLRGKKALIKTKLRNFRHFRKRKIRLRVNVLKKSSSAPGGQTKHCSSGSDAERQCSSSDCEEGKRCITT